MGDDEHAGSITSNTIAVAPIERFMLACIFEFELHLAIDVTRARILTAT
jgi:hypothetical protein